MKERLALVDAALFFASLIAMKSEPQTRWAAHNQYIVEKKFEIFFLIFLELSNCLLPLQSQTKGNKLSSLKKVQMRK